MDNKYIKYFGFRYYKLVDKNKYWNAFIDLTKIHKPIEDFMSVDGSVDIERFKRYLTDNRLLFAVSINDIKHKKGNIGGDLK